MGPTVQINQVDNGFIVQTQFGETATTFIATTLEDVQAMISAIFASEIVVPAGATAEAPEKEEEKTTNKKAAAKKSAPKKAKSKKAEKPAPEAEEESEEESDDIMGDIVGDDKPELEVTAETLTALIREKAAALTPKEVITKFKSFGFANTEAIFAEAPEKAAEIYAAIAAL